MYGDTLKIASGLGHTAKQATDDMRDGENSQDDDDNQANFFCHFLLMQCWGYVTFWGGSGSPDPYL